MNGVTIAKLAVSAATFQIDKPYDYRIPDSLMDAVVPGIRVVVPFGNGNRSCVGFVLSVSKTEADRTLKFIESALDDSPVLSQELLKLAMWMSERFFCTVFDAARSMLPSGMWFKDGVRKIGDKTVTFVSLASSEEETRAFIASKSRRAPQQAAIMELLLHEHTMSASELTYYTGATRGSITALRKQGMVTTESREVFRRPPVNANDYSDNVTLSAPQARVFEELRTLLSKNAGAALLLGVTGSGKTSVYIKLIDEALKVNKTAIVLVPEIALTPQLTGIFAAYFGEKIAVIHSALSVGERYDEWKRIRSGSVSVVVGTRSAVFAPLENLGLIVIDEEQEHTYKSENSPRYHARDVAKYRCANSGALLLLGSATPSVESMYYAKTGKYSLCVLENRFNETGLPSVILADMRDELKEGSGSAVSAILLGELEKNLACGEQSILFLNRRGANSLVVCPECGFTHECEKCSVSLTYHSANNRLMCHYCGTSIPTADNCPECGGKMKFMGTGTQRVEEELLTRFPEAHILRMDADTVSQANSHEAILSEFRGGEADILLGTQMVTKGLDFENVTLVGVLSSDASLYMNDYRAHERTFSMITQVIGRSGRGKKPGRAVIQTLTPNHEVIRLASEQDYDSFYSREIELRRIIASPPFSDLLTVTVIGPIEADVIKSSIKMRTSLEGYLSDLENVKVLGPAPAVVTRINNKYRYKVTVLCENSRRIRETIAHSLREFAKDKSTRGLNAFADIDPFD